MENNLLNLYLQRNKSSDRRRQDIPVNINNRSAEDRRLQPRPCLDLSVKQDYEKIQKTFAAFKPKADQFIKQVNTLDNFAVKNQELTKAVFSALSPITPIRRVSSLPDNIDDGNYTRAAGLVGLALINLPEDGRDLRAAGKQIASKLTDKIKYEPSYNYKEFQHDFSFFKGTLLEPLLKIPGKTGEWIADKLHRFDKPLAETKIGDLFERIFKFDMKEMVNTGKIYGRDYPILAYRYEGKRLAVNIARGLRRMPLLSVVSLGLLEIPAIYKAIKSENNIKNKAKKGFKQTLKGLIYVPTMAGSIGLFGGWLSRKGACGSLVGMGIGSIIGALFYNIAKKSIDKVVKD